MERRILETVQDRALEGMDGGNVAGDIAIPDGTGYGPTVAAGVVVVRCVLLDILRTGWAMKVLG